MGCCGVKPKNEQIIEYYWNSLPITKMTLSEYKDKIAINNERLTFPDDRDERHVFKDFFLNKNFLLSNDEEANQITTKLFNSMTYLIKPELLTFLLAFLCTFDDNKTKNTRDLKLISIHLQLDLVSNSNGENYIARSDYKSLYLNYLNMLTVYSYEYIIDGYNIDSKVKEHLCKIYRKELTIKIADEKTMGNVRGDKHPFMSFIDDISVNNEFETIRGELTRLERIESLTLTRNVGTGKGINATVYNFGKLANKAEMTGSN
jgi:hypothetical protein